jgi:hypothetical protein
LDEPATETEDSALHHTIALTDDSERALRKIAEQGGRSADDALTMIAGSLLASEPSEIIVAF